MYPIQLLIFLLLWNYLLILKMLTETLFRFPFSVFGRCSLVPISHWLQKCASINLSQSATGMITESQAASCKHSKLPRSRVFESGYWKDFQNKKVISKLTFSSSKKQKIVKTIIRMYAKYLFVIICLEGCLVLVEKARRLFCDRWKK